MEYEKAGISPGCPFQGCFYPDRMKEIRQGVRSAFEDLARAQEVYRSSLQAKLCSAATKAKLLAQGTSQSLKEHEQTR